MIRHETRGLLLLAVCAALVLTAPAQAQRGGYRDKAFLRTNPQFLAAFQDPVSRVSASTVRVLCDGSEAALGTVVARDGCVLTKASDLKGKITCRLADGREFVARLVGVHEGHDLAMLKLDARGLIPVDDWRTSKDDPVGSWVASAGPGGEPVAVGVISVAARKVLPSRLVQAPDPAMTGYLGVGLEETDDGVRISEIIAGSAAARAGLKVDDLIIAVAGKAVSGSKVLREALGRYKPGEVVAVRIKRGDDELDFEPRLGKRPPARSDIQNNMGSELSKRRGGFPNILQHDSVLRPKDCGGPLVDLDGKIVGINVARAGRTESYAIPAEVVRPLLPELMSGRLAPQQARADAAPR
jgi:serine protease Do